MEHTGTGSDTDTGAIKAGGVGGSGKSGGVGGSGSGSGRGFLSISPGGGSGGNTVPRTRSSTSLQEMLRQNAAPAIRAVVGVASANNDSTEKVRGVGGKVKGKRVGTTSSFLYSFLSLV